MNHAEVSRVLAKAAAFDSRTVGEADILAWHEAIGDLPLADALAAVAQHFRESTDWLKPAHIRAIAADLDRERRRRAREAKEAQLAIEAAAVTDARPLADRAPEIQKFVREQALKFAVPEAERRHQLALKRARAERGRPEKLPSSKPAKSKRGEQLPEPKTEQAVALARAYLAEGYEPKDVSERLGISRKWCERASRDRKPGEGGKP